MLEERLCYFMERTKCGKIAISFRLPAFSGTPWTYRRMIHIALKYHEQQIPIPFQERAIDITRCNVPEK